jgi:hypothetical protein
MRMRSRDPRTASFGEAAGTHPNQRRAARPSCRPAQWLKRTPASAPESATRPHEQPDISAADGRRGNHRYQRDAIPFCSAPVDRAQHREIASTASWQARNRHVNVTPTA